MLPTMEVVEYTGLRQQIHWRLVLKSGLFNQFMARLYNNSIADKIVPQDFKLRTQPGSFAHLLLNGNLPKNRGVQA